MLKSQGERTPRCTGLIAPRPSRTLACRASRMSLSKSRIRSDEAKSSEALRARVHRLSYVLGGERKQLRGKRLSRFEEDF